MLLLGNAVFSVSSVCYLLDFPTLWRRFNLLFISAVLPLPDENLSLYYKARNLMEKTPEVLGSAGLTLTHVLIGGMMGGRGIHSGS